MRLYNCDLIEFDLAWHCRSTILFHYINWTSIKRYKARYKWEWRNKKKKSISRQ